MRVEDVFVMAQHPEACRGQHTVCYMSFHLHGNEIRRPRPEALFAPPGALLSGNVRALEEQVENSEAESEHSEISAFSTMMNASSGRFVQKSFLSPVAASCKRAFYHQWPLCAKELSITSRRLAQRSFLSPVAAWCKKAFYHQWPLGAKELSITSGRFVQKSFLSPVASRNLQPLKKLISAEDLKIEH